MPIHATAVIDKSAEIDTTADIGPYVIIDGPVRIRAGVRVFPHVYVTGWTDIAEGCEIHPHCVIGHLPQDFHFKGERSYCRIGKNTIIRENTSVHRATLPEGCTIVGESCFLLANTHVAHDAVLGDRVTLISFSAIAGHGQVGDGVTLSSFSGLHQFVRVGELVMVGPGSAVVHDIPPFLLVTDRAVCKGVNLVGMKRASLPSEDIDEIRGMYRNIYRSGRTMSTSVEEMAGSAVTPSGKTFLEFFEHPGKRGIARPVGLRHTDH